MHANHRLILLLLLSSVGFISACSHYDNYAPVYSAANPNKLPENILKSAPPPTAPIQQPKIAPSLLQLAQKPEQKPVEKPISLKFHVVKPGETLYSIGVSSRQDFQDLSKWNNIPAPYAIKLGQKIIISNPDPAVVQKQRLDLKPIDHSLKKIDLSGYEAVKPVHQKLTPDPKPITTIVGKKAKNNLKSSIISIDKEKVLKLSFQWPVKGKVLKTFSQTNFKGIDIAGTSGQSVVAAHTGKVAYSGQGLIGFGKVLIIKHNEQHLSAYANVGQIEVSEGQQVEKGQLIAKIGRSGSKKPSLHFEIRKNGKPVNPLKYLPK